MEKFTEVQRLANSGDKIKIIEPNGYHKLLDWLVKVGDILTVEALNENFPRYPYGRDDGFHIKEVAEFAAPEDVEILILPRQYVVLEEVQKTA